MVGGLAKPIYLMAVPKKGVTEKTWGSNNSSKICLQPHDFPLLGLIL